MKNALMITFKDLTRQLNKFGLSGRLEKITNTMKDRKAFEQEFSLDEVNLDDEFSDLSEVTP